MYNFERRLNLAQKEFKDLRDINVDNQGVPIGKLEIFIMLTRTVTFIMQNDLKTRQDFEAWYKDKKEEMSNKFDYFIKMRNNIEKEGTSPVRVFETKIDFQYKGKDAENVGMVTSLDGRKDVQMGKITTTAYFDKDKKKDFIADCEEYLIYLSSLTKEAVAIFPEIGTN